MPRDRRTAGHRREVKTHRRSVPWGSRWLIGTIVGVISCTSGLIGVFLQHHDAELALAAQTGATALPTAEFVSGLNGERYVAVDGQLYAQSPPTVTVTEPQQGRPSSPIATGVVPGSFGTGAGSDDVVLPFPWMTLAEILPVALCFGLAAALATKPKYIAKYR